MGNASHLGTKTLKAHFGDEREQVRRKGQERMSLNGGSCQGVGEPWKRKVKAQESNGPAEDAILPVWIRIVGLRKPLGARPDLFGETEKRREGIGR